MHSLYDYIINCSKIQHVVLKGPLALTLLVFAQLCLKIHIYATVIYLISNEQELLVRVALCIKRPVLAPQLPFGSAHTALNFSSLLQSAKLQIPTALTELLGELMNVV